MSRPGFLKRPMPPAPPRPKGEVRSGSYALEVQAAPWKFTLLHDRPEDILLWVTRGQGRVIVNGIRRGISTNNALFLPAGTLFSVEMQQGTQALFVQSPAGLSPYMPHAPLLLRVRDSLSQAELTGTIDAMNRETTQKRPMLQEALAAHVGLIAVWLHRQVQAGATDTPPESAAQRLVRRYAEAVTREFRQPKAMGLYAEALDVTPTHLSRVCRGCCGKTAADILTERKLHAARLALESPAPAVKEVARSLGFASPAYFTRFIQNHTGHTPSALRAATRRSPARA